MASIYGLTVKSLKSFIGHEGDVFQGNLYLGNKKIGWWSQNSDGSIVDDLYLDAQYSEKKLRAACAKGSNKMYDFELIMAELVDLIEGEKIFKKIIKKGNQLAVFVTDGFESVWFGYEKDLGPSMDDIIIKEMMETYEVKKLDRQSKYFKITVYRDLEQFNLGEPICLEDIILNAK